MTLFRGTKLNTVGLLTIFVTVNIIYGAGTATGTGTTGTSKYYTPLNLKERRTQSQTSATETESEEDLALCPDARVCLTALQTAVVSHPQEIRLNHAGTRPETEADHDIDVDALCNGVQKSFVTYAMCAIDHCDVSCDDSVQVLQQTLDIVDSLIASYNDGVSCEFEAVICDNNTDGGEDYEYEYDEYEHNNSTNGTNATNATEYEGEYETNPPGTGNQTNGGSFAVKVNGDWMVLISALMISSMQLID